ncbi:glycosyltransferase [Cellulomonas sp. zg-ZUI199]|uniref:Glycosyltransferase n=1 Tax=Cellulomonas wangleii TaxID=2816956 RepID=A0ABX8DCN8_9CELL|nr:MULTISPECIES: glycosyltransferase [Cellulomonas]MBO0900466.1 glycosyltransferase [Cellulomonas sp. zg-ZUI22]MBO0926431.1 glycosyltransferase [Cellulomonas wangleii]QVI63897.1 glycosyltransferase [Cellulomonas wangleii]
MDGAPDRAGAVLTVIVPTFNEAPNVPELVRRVGEATRGLGVDLLVVDDSTDDTADVARALAPTAELPVRVIHRRTPEGGLGGAVLAGVRASTTPYVLVMDGDLQHPPELIPTLLARVQEPDVDVVVASRYIGDGSSAGLSGAVRRAVSSTSTAVTRAMFPVRLRDCSDPMTGFFAVRRAAIDLDTLRPRGFKILLEILARHPMRVVEVPFVFGQRYAGASKANLAQGVHFMWQLAGLRFGRMSRFAIIGGLGALANIGIVAAMTSLGAHWLLAAIVAAEVTIAGNFLLQERFVFRDLRHEGKGVWARFGQSFVFNNVETMVRLPLVGLLVNTMHVAAVLATAITIAIAFVVRFTFHSRVVYRPRASSRREQLVEREAEQAVAPPAPSSETV